MDDALRGGIAVYNAGGYHAAHDAWEDRWLDLESGADDERLLHGLIQFTAAIHHARTRNWSGATGLAGSAGEYLADLPGDYREVNLDDVRGYLRRLAGDPEVIERSRPPSLTHRGEAIEPADLDVPAAIVAALAIAGPVQRAAAFAREELEEGTRTRFIALVMDFAADAENRALVYRRLREHVARRERKARDVEGLFD